MITWLEPQPSPEERPSIFPSPFDDVGPHPLARLCAERLQEDLRKGLIAPGLPTSVLTRPEGGKMFGVLLVESGEGRVGFLKAVSGQVERAWNLEGYAPPIFDEVLRAQTEGPAETVVKGLTARVDAARLDPALLAARAALVELDRQHAQHRETLKRRHAQNKAERRAHRLSSPAPETLQALDQRSRADDWERRRSEANAREEQAAAQAKVFPLERRLAALERLRRLVSQETMRRLWDSYQLTSFSGETSPLRALFHQGEPPSGAGDCAAPKLLAAARAAGLKPLALAEFWWGSPPPGGARVEGMYFPACKEKCAPVLAFMMRGLEVAPRRLWKPRDLSEDALAIVHLEERFLVLNKPAGMLSVPGRDPDVSDCLVARVKRRFPHATGPLAVHRLDLDTSGVLLVALDEETYRVLQRQFLEHQVHKRYIAMLDGHIDGESGTIELPLRVDLDQRPRQVVDFAQGKPATTRWSVLSREGGRTRVAFFPLTGRTHQLRVHASHQLGLGVPIVGDRLYGRGDTRLYLHAEVLGFRHPVTGESIEVTVPAPF